MQTRILHYAPLFLAATVISMTAWSAETHRERHERIIEQLVSPNKAPKVSKAGEMAFPESYDRKAQAKVLEAWESLLKEGYDAFPALLAHFEDERYSCTVESGAADRNFSVGAACFEIMVRQIEPYDRIHYIGRQKPSGIEGDLETWYTARKERTLRELQIEVAENVLKEMNTFRDVGNREEAKQMNIAMLMRLLADIKSRKGAILNERVNWRMVGLPR